MSLIHGGAQRKNTYWLNHNDISYKLFLVNHPSRFIQKYFAHFGVELGNASPIKATILTSSQQWYGGHVQCTPKILQVVFLNQYHFVSFWRIPYYFLGKSNGWFEGIGIFQGATDGKNPGVYRGNLVPALRRNDHVCEGSWINDRAGRGRLP